MISPENNVWGDADAPATGISDVKKALQLKQDTQLFIIGVLVFIITFLVFFPVAYWINNF